VSVAVEKVTEVRGLLVLEMAEAAEALTARRLAPQFPIVRAQAPAEAKREQVAEPLLLPRYFLKVDW
jgi:hypothetical protein